MILVHVFFDGNEGVRIFGTSHVIRKSEVGSNDWDVYMDIIQEQIKQRDYTKEEIIKMYEDYYGGSENE